MMTSDEPQSKADGIPLDTLAVNEKARSNNNTIPPAKPANLTKPNVEVYNGYLVAPQVAPIRPASPDTLSNLSVEEYELLRVPSIRHGESDQSGEVAATGPRTWRHRLAHFWVVNKGIVFMLIAQVFGVLMNVTTRLLEVEGNKGKGLHPFQILFARMSITTLLASTYMWYNKTPHFPFGTREIRWLLIARGLGGFCGVFGMYFSLLYLPLADATVITFLAPGIACFACSILLKQPFTRVEQVACLISLVGVVLIARPTTLFHAATGGGSSATGLDDVAPSNATVPTPAPADASSYEDVTPIQRLTAVGVALIGVLGSSVAYTTIRWIGKRAHPLITVNYFAAWCFIVSVVMQTALPEVGWQLPADLKEWGYLLFLGICGFVMVCFPAQELNV